MKYVIFMIITNCVIFMIITNCVIFMIYTNCVIFINDSKFQIMFFQLQKIYHSLNNIILNIFFYILVHRYMISINLKLSTFSWSECGKHEVLKLKIVYWLKFLFEILNVFSPTNSLLKVEEKYSVQMTPKNRKMKLFWYWTFQIIPMKNNL